MRLRTVAAGTFYPDSPKALGKMLDSFQSLPAPPLPGPPVGLLLPHAGYVYSGEVAALGYRSLQKPPETVVVIGPSHSVAFPGTSVFAGEAVATPLGDLAVDQEAARELLESHESMAQFLPAFAQEHSAEVHFPLVKRFLPDSRVLPLVTGQGRDSVSNPLADSLVRLSKTRQILVVASTDLCHYPEYEVAVKADREFLEAVLTGDVSAVERADQKLMRKGWERFHCTHCGNEPLRALMLFAKLMGADKRELLAYRNSGDATGDRSRVVGYAAVAFCR